MAGPVAPHDDGVTASAPPPTRRPGDSPPTESGPPARRPPLRRLLAVVAVALAVGGGALGIAASMDDPEGRAARDAAPIVVGRVPVELARRGDRSGADLPPLAMVLDRPAPGGIAALPAAEQVTRLQALARPGAPGRRWVELGRALMETGDADGARAAFRRAATLLPGDPAPLVGLAMSDGIAGGAGLDAAAARMDALVTGYGRSQVVMFNRGWLAAYRGRSAQVLADWSRTVALGPRTPLGRTAAALLQQIRSAGG